MGYAEKLLNEVRIDYQRSMNKITFDKVVSEDPERFSFVVIEEKPAEIIPESGIANMIFGKYFYKIIERH